MTGVFCNTYVVSDTSCLAMIECAVLSKNLKM